MKLRWLALAFALLAPALHAAGLRATVTYVNGREEERVVTILGVDEADIARGEVSLHSPIARALLRARVGDAVRMQTPGGWDEVEVVAIAYPEG